MSVVYALPAGSVRVSIRHVGLLALMAAIVLGAALPLPAFWLTQANYIGIAALATLGLTLLTGVVGLTSFGQAAFVGIGAYTSALLTVHWQVSPWLALLAAVTVTMAAAGLIGAITLRLSGHFLPLATIAWALSLYYVFGNAGVLGRSDGIIGVPPLRLGPVVMDGPRPMFLLIWTALALALAATLNLLASRPGRALRSLNGGAAMAESCGIHAAGYRWMAFVASSMFAAVAGWLYALLQRGVNPTPFHLNTGIEYLFMAVIGGAAQVWGAVIGAAVVTGVKDVLQRVLPAVLGQVGQAEIIVFGAALILILHRLPSGVGPAVTRAASVLRARWWPASPPTRAREPKDDRIDDDVAPSGRASLPRRPMPQRGSVLLEVDHVRRIFGGLVAVNDLSFQVKAGEVVALIGPNGAGKSTSFNLISRMLPLTSGEIRFHGAPDGKPCTISSLSAREVSRLGIARTFQHVRLLPGMTVLDSVLIGAHARGRAGALRSVLRLNSAEETAMHAEALRQIHRVGLGPFAHHEAVSLSLGQQRIVEIARALCCDPALLLLDEPAAGLRHLEKQALGGLLRQLRHEGMSVLLVEHDMEFVMGLADRIVVMEFGTLIAQGTPQSIRHDPAVIQAYLGADL